MKNDELIKTYLAKIEETKAKLGDRPKISYETNGLIPSGDKKHNINILNLESAVKIIAQLLMEASFEMESRKVLGLPHEEPTLGAYKVDAYIKDLKLRVSTLLWEEEKKKLVAMEKKLEELFSEQAKTENAIKDIAKELGL